MRGYMYLCKELALPDGTSRNMCGVIDGNGPDGEKLRSLGYREAVMETEPRSGCLSPASAAMNSIGPELN